MKNTIHKISLLFLFFFALTAYAQSENSVALSSVSLADDKETVRISIKTSESFIAGANRYVLHIGAKHFLLNEHPDGSLSEIVFLLPLSDYEMLADQAKMVLVYGFYHANTLIDGEGQQNEFIGTNWNLGKFVSQSFTSK